MGKAKKKNFTVTCEVNLDATKIETVEVRSTKAHIAVKQAEDKLKARGFFHVSVKSCCLSPN